MQRVEHVRQAWFLWKITALSSVSVPASASGCIDSFRETRGSRALPFMFEGRTGQIGVDYRTRMAGIANTSAGVYVNDFYRDGREDLLFVGGERPRLYENTGKEFREVDVLPDLQPYLKGDDRVHGALFLDTDVFGETAFYLSPMAMLGILLTWMLVFAAVATVYFARVDLG